VGNADRRTNYEDLLRRYLPALRRLARSYAREAAEQEDLLQEIALGLWTALPQFRGDANPRLRAARAKIEALYKDEMASPLGAESFFEFSNFRKT
jgi:RNA polymerase sigma factor (sigma-70 family)